MQMKANDYKPKDSIRIIREWTELTQKDFANSIHRSRKTIEGYEYGTINISFDNFLKICETHDIEVVIRKKKNNFFLETLKVPFFL